MMGRKTIGMVTYEKLPLLTASDQQLTALFMEQGIIATPVIWSDPAVRWEDYSLLLLRSAWDSHYDPAAFSRWLDHLAAIGVRTLNPVSLIRRNQHKFYLRDLERAGVRIVPTCFVGRTAGLDLSALPSSGWVNAVIKPAVSANSYLTECFSVRDYERVERKYRDFARDRDLLIQEFMPEIQQSGEISMIFINRSFSHALVKRPKAADFRVQADYGGEASRFRPDEAIMKMGEKLLDQFAGDMLYARVDGVIRGAVFYLMEIELTDPELYFDLCPDGRAEFVRAAIEWL